MKPPKVPDSIAANPIVLFTWLIVTRHVTMSAEELEDHDADRNISWDEMNWFAQDKDGQWFGYRDRPICGTTMWHSESLTANQYRLLSRTRPYGDWKESLREVIR